MVISKPIFTINLLTMPKSYKKTCKKCNSKNIKKDWRMRGKQRYKCKDCKHLFQNKSRKLYKVNINKLYYRYSKGKQTYKELAREFNISIKTVQKYLDLYEIQEKTIASKEIVLLIDTTYFGSFWLMLFKDAKSKKILHYKIVDYETNQAYKEWILELEQQWWIIKAIVSDGRRWLLGWFDNIPTQMCQFHQKQIVRRYLTLNPILKPNIELRKIVNVLHMTDKNSFSLWLNKWYEKNKNFLNEKSINLKWKTYFIHKKTRSAYFSLKKHLKYLFIYQDYLWKLEIPNTTNSLESYFWHIKDKIRLHRGLKKKRKIKLIISLLNL